MSCGPAGGYSSCLTTPSEAMTTPQLICATRGLAVTRAPLSLALSMPPLTLLDEADSSIDSVVNTYLIESCGLRPTDPNPADPIGLVVSSGCNYFAPLSFPEVVDLGLRVNKLGNSSVTYEVGFFQQGSDHVAAVGGFTHVFVHPVERRPTAMVEGMRKGLEKLVVTEGKANL